MSDFDNPKKPINVAVIDHVIGVTTVWGGEEVYITEAQIAEWQADPDLFAARHFGLTVDEYREWIELNGKALCGKLTKSGRPCNAAFGFQLDVGEWKRRHRREACHAHR
jgi:hypothetical protein